MQEIKLIQLLKVVIQTEYIVFDHKLVNQITNLIYYTNLDNY
jgi:hypothetical protein